MLKLAENIRMTNDASKFKSYQKCKVTL